MIYQSDLNFLEEAKRAFTEEPQWATYRNNDETHIALRTGIDRSGILIYRLDEKVGDFSEVLDRAANLILKEED